MAWTLNRYQASRGVTSFELTHGKAYESPLVPFGCPVYAYLRPLTGKGNPKWRMAIFLGKTEGQDAWVVGEGQNVLLTRSVRRIDRPWSKFMTYFRDFTAHSWEFQVNFGGRIVPSKRAVGPIPLNMRRKELAEQTLRFTGSLMKRPKQWRIMQCPRKVRRKQSARCRRSR